MGRESECTAHSDDHPENGDGDAARREKLVGNVDEYGGKTDDEGIINFVEGM
jgi:hypothetical protein